MRVIVKCSFVDRSYSPFLHIVWMAEWSSVRSRPHVGGLSPLPSSLL